MKLTELKPHWIGLNQWVAADPFYIGVSFLCPHCVGLNLPEHGPERVRRLAVSFWPPIDPANWKERIMPPAHDKFHQRVSGETFDTLTLEPSAGFDPHWHGRITNGEMR